MVDLTPATAQRYSLRKSRSSSPLSVSAFAGRIEASRSSTSSLNAVAILAATTIAIKLEQGSALRRGS